MLHTPIGHVFFIVGCVVQLRIGFSSRGQSTRRLDNLSGTRVQHFVDGHQTNTSFHFMF